MARGRGSRAVRATGWFGLGWLAKGRVGGLLLGTLSTGTLLLVGLVVLAAQWVADNPDQVVLGLLVGGLLLVILGPEWRRSRELPAGWSKGLRGGRLPRSIPVPFSYVYILREWRHPDGHLLTSRELRDSLVPRVLHLVYIGKTNDIKARFAQHAAEKVWWHDRLVPEIHGFWDERSALAEEARLLRFWSRVGLPPHEMVRENIEGRIVKRDAAYCARMLQLALPQKRALR